MFLISKIDDKKIVKNGIVNTITKLNSDEPRINNR